MGEAAVDQLSSDALTMCSAQGNCSAGFAVLKCHGPALSRRIPCPQESHPDILAGVLVGAVWFWGFNPLKCSQFCWRLIYYGVLYPCDISVWEETALQAPLRRDIDPDEGVALMLQAESILEVRELSFAIVTTTTNYQVSGILLMKRRWWEGDVGKWHSGFKGSICAKKHRDSHLSIIPYVFVISEIQRSSQKTNTARCSSYSYPIDNFHS